MSLDWGSVAAWAGAVATVLMVITTSLVALGFFDRFRAARVRLSFEDGEPWCRLGLLDDSESALWVRIGVENIGESTAAGCVGRLITVTTNGERRADFDPVQLRWAGVPRSRSFDPIELRPGQREYLNVLVLAQDSDWRVVTFEDPDFDPGFTTTLPRGAQHELQVSVFASNATTAASSLLVLAGAQLHERTLQLA